jgi:hypothetical protein
MKRLAILALAMWGSAAAGPSGAVSFSVGDGDFVSGVYSFHYYNHGSSRTVVNGVDLAIADPTLTNAGWVCCRDDGPRFWHAQGHPFGFAELTFGALTMGWDFSAVTGQIEKIELNPRHFLFQQNPWNEEAVGDQVAGFVSTPAAFGAGPYVELYRHTGTAGTQTAIGAGTLTDYASAIAPAWLANPGLLEFRFTYEQTPGTNAGSTVYTETDLTIPAGHLQLFRDVSGTGDNGFVFRVTLRQEPTIPTASPAALSLFILSLCGTALLRRRSR